MTKETMPAGTTSGTPQVLLAHHLKQLKLPTVLREDDKVAREGKRSVKRSAAKTFDLAIQELQRQTSDQGVHDQRNVPRPLDRRRSFVPGFAIGTPRHAVPPASGAGDVLQSDR